MTSDEFNNKYKNYLEERHYGLAIDKESVVDFLDNIFKDLIEIPDFKYSQIKLKFGYARFYSTLLSTELSSLIENKINSLIHDE